MAIKYTLRLARSDDFMDACFAIDVCDGRQKVGSLIMGVMDEILDNLLDYGPEDYDMFYGDAGTTIAWLERITVEPAYRRQGYAQIMVRKAMRRLKRKGFAGCFVTAYPLDDNIPKAQLIEFYEQLGFVVDGVDLMGRTVMWQKLQE